MRCEDVNGLGYGVPQIIDGSRGAFSQEGFELGESVLNGVEVWAVGREESDLGARCLDGLSGFEIAMSRQIVEDDDIAGFQGRRQNLLGIGSKPAAGHGTVQNHWGCHPRQA